MVFDHDGIGADGDVDMSMLTLMMIWATRTTTAMTMVIFAVSPAMMTSVTMTLQQLLLPEHDGTLHLPHQFSPQTVTALQDTVPILDRETEVTLPAPKPHRTHQLPFTH
jgi:hypothetical protein